MFLAVVFPIILVLATLLQYTLYRLYNRKYHPFIDMVKTSKISFKSGPPQVFVINISFTDDEMEAGGATVKLTSIRRLPHNI